jgi:hypothetical protein
VIDDVLDPYEAACLRADEAEAELERVKAERDAAMEVGLPAAETALGLHKALAALRELEQADAKTPILTVNHIARAAIADIEGE